MGSVSSHMAWGLILAVGLALICGVSVVWCFGVLVFFLAMDLWCFGGGGFLGCGFVVLVTAVAVGVVLGLGLGYGGGRVGLGWGFVVFWW